MRIWHGARGGAAARWAPRLSLALSSTVSALDLNRRQWLLVAGVFLAFMFLIIPVIYAVRVLMDRLEKAELELRAMNASTDAGSAKASPSHRGCRVIGSSSGLAHGLSGSLKQSPPASDVLGTPPASARLIPEGDELDMAAPGASEEPAAASQSPPRMAATAPIVARDAEAWPSPRSWPGTSRSEPGVAGGARAAAPRPGPDAEPEASDAGRRRDDQHDAHHAHHHAHHHTHHHSQMFGVRGALRRLTSSHHLGHEAAAEPPEHSEDSDGGSDPGMHTVEGGEIVDDMGISGMCLVCTDKQMRTVVLIAAQAFVLQALILYYIAAALQPHPRLSAAKALPVSIVYAAIYLQFIVVVKDIPRSLFVARWFHQLHEKWTETIVFGFIFVVDAFVIPLAQLFIGALFLCTSTTIVDVLMNSFALSYISSIDNMILEMRKTLTDLSSDSDEYDDVKFPVNPGVIRALTIAIVIVPVIPVAFSLTMAYLGLRVFLL
mmetsp:Transcript_99298/g.258913  ORF Transcript_99298/g.258913 Transcript_99298/m.258913 type:complete len:491 (-) Transcript_99298:87-1559(-)